MRILEVDYGPTQEYKKQRLNEIFGSVPRHVRYVPMDFTKDDLLTQLRKHGYSASDKTLFIWEGVTMYLPESAIRSTLRFVRDHSAPGSVVAFDYLLNTHPNVNNSQSTQARWGEPWIFGFAGEGAAEFVRGEGLEVVEDVLTSDPRSRRYVQRSDGSSSLPQPDLALLSKVGRCKARVPRPN